MAEMGAGAFCPHLLHVPGHVEEKFRLVFTGLDVAHVQYPYLLDAAVVGGGHLVEEQMGREGAQPQVVVRPAPVAHMIVDAVAAATLPFGCGGKVAYVAVVVVAPHQAHVVGHLKAGVIHVLHFLVGDEHLRHLLHVIVYILAQQLALVGDDAFQNAFLLLDGFGVLHGAVVHTAHADGVENGLAGHLAQTALPEPSHLGAVVHIVVVAGAAAGPLAGRARCHGLAVRAAYVDAVAGGGLAVAGYKEEGLRTLVHGGPEGVGAQAQQQFEDAFVGLGTDASFQSRLVGLAGPRHHAPVFVVDEDAAVLHTGMLFLPVVGGQGEPLQGVRCRIGPPCPGRYTQQTRHLEQSVGHAVAVAAGDV